MLAALTIILIYCRIGRHKLERFVSAVNASESIEMIRENGVTFVTVNSMALEGDDCTMCTQARRDLSVISQRLNCAKVKMLSISHMRAKI